MSKRLWPLVALMLAACSSEPAESTDTTTTQTQAVTFSTCMREHGVTEFPDPDGKGELTLDGVVNGSSIDPQSATFKRAVKACKDLQPPGFTGRKATPEEQDVRLQFAQCMRDHGVADFPDPAEGDPLVDTTRIPSAQAPGGMETLNAAMQECREFAEKLGIRGR
jgi:hypothetical protein